MAIDKNAADKAAPREVVEQQDQSIKARKNQLFEVAKPDDGVSHVPFRVYLKDTPPAPMSTPMKAALWSVAVVAGLLFLAAIWVGR